MAKADEVALSAPGEKRPPIDKKKGPLASKRPKSREETPKEGGGNAQERITALQQYVIAAHQKQEENC